MYYKCGAGYEYDFSTYASASRALALAEADDFHARLSLLERGNALPAEIRVLETGVGNGFSASCFLGRLRLLDARKGTRFSPRVRYTLSDFSEEMLCSAMASPGLRAHSGSVERVRARAGNAAPRKKFLLARSNELLDDIPARVAMRSEGRVLEARLGLLVDEKAFPGLESGRAAKEFVSLAKGRRSGTFLGPAFARRRVPRAWRAHVPRQLRVPGAGSPGVRLRGCGGGAAARVLRGKEGRALLPLEGAHARVSPRHFRSESRNLNP
jgi:hypothetical protein